MSINDLIKRNKALAEVNSQLIQQITSGYYSQSAVNAFHAIGIANKRWEPCIREGASITDGDQVDVYYKAITAGIWNMVFGIPLPFIIGSKNLVITRIMVGIRNADGNDFVTNMRLSKWTAHATDATVAVDGTNFTTPQEVIYDITDVVTDSSFKRLVIKLGLNVTTTDQINISYVNIEYYYA